MEVPDAEELFGAVLEVNEERFDEGGMRELYDRPDYPLPRGTLTRRAQGGARRATTRHQNETEGTAREVRRSPQRLPID
jgi:hypothetical protein